MLLFLMVILSISPPLSFFPVFLLCLENTTEGSLSLTPSSPSRGPLCMAVPHHPQYLQGLPLHELTKALHPT